MAEVPLGTELLLDAPYGSLTLPHEPRRPVVFLTGGIGVTPVRSIALQAAHDRTGHTWPCSTPTGARRMPPSSASRDGRAPLVG